MGRRLPPGTKLSDIPGNRPIDEWRDKQRVGMDQGLREAFKHAHLLDPEHEKDLTRNLVTFLQENGYGGMVDRVQDEILVEQAKRHVGERLGHHQMHRPEDGPRDYVTEHTDLDPRTVGTESWDHLKRDLLYQELPERLHDEVEDPDWYKDNPRACPECTNPKHGGHYCREREAIVNSRHERIIHLRDDHNWTHNLHPARNQTGQSLSEGDRVQIEYQMGPTSSLWMVTEVLQEACRLCEERPGPLECSMCGMPMCAGCEAPCTDHHQDCYPSEDCHEVH